MTMCEISGAPKRALHGVLEQRPTRQRHERLGLARTESGPLAGGHEDDGDAQEARTSSRMASALSSFVFSASASSETRI